MGGVLLFSLSMSLTSCEDILGEWSRPTPNPVTPGGGDSDGGGSTTIAVTGVTLDKANLRFVKTDLTAQTLTATVEPADATDKTVTWTSSDESVATVDANGQVTPIKAGTVTIKATAGDKTATSTVYVYDKIVDINTVSANVTVDDGESWLINGNGSEVAYSITIGAGAKATLNGISIKPSGNDPGISCSSTGNSTIILADGSTNTVDKTGNFYAAGIQVGGAGTTLTIDAETAGTGKLTAKGANMSYGGAGIGTNGAQSTAPTQTCGDIIIKGGIIDAQGGIDSAGIGTGVANCDAAGKDTTQKCGTITITGGTVTATGGFGAAGIGTGNEDSKVGPPAYAASQTCGDITIGAGVTSVTATKGLGSPNSIGAGNEDGTQTCGTITIDPSANVTQN